MFQFPIHIREYSGFVDLTDEEQIEFTSLMEFFASLGNELRNGARRSASHSLFDFVDNLELDLAVRIGSAARTTSNFSSWLVHSSWAFDVEEDLLATLPTELVLITEVSEPSSRCSQSEIESWFRTVGGGLSDAVAATEVASSLGSAIAHHLVVEILAVKMLQCCYRCRLNPLIRR